MKTDLFVYGPHVRAIDGRLSAVDDELRDVTQVLEQSQVSARGDSFDAA
ncbi:hypothetical protein ABIE21_002465 [Conyzicola nivalis]|uniref:Uncharacterized protein n=1 Tax=Conyzicola nivalis TaxID=1477021 RepID=A0ABV2QPR9_9MICO